jgi:hypothetical protein
MTNKVAFMNENDNDSHLDLQLFFLIILNKYFFNDLNVYLVRSWKLFISFDCKI